jgi:hypothetical protein
MTDVTMKRLMVVLGWLFGLGALFFALLVLIVGRRYLETVGTWDGEY